MRRPVAAALLASLALSAYVATQPGDGDDLAPEGASSRRPGGSARAPVSGDGRVAVSAGPKTTTTGATPADRLEALSAALDAWQVHRRSAGLAAPDALSRQAWASQQLPPPPPPPPMAAEPPPPPMAPRFPHTWVGRYLDPKPKAIIAGPAGAWVAQVGDVLDGQWRVDAIAERQMTLTYMPLNQSQSVALK